MCPTEASELQMNVAARKEQVTVHSQIAYGIYLACDALLRPLAVDSRIGRAQLWLPFDLQISTGRQDLLENAPVTLCHAKSSVDKLHLINKGS